MLRVTSGYSRNQRPLRGTRFESIDEIKAESKKALMAMPEKDYLACFEKLKRPLRGTRFESIDQLKAESKKAMMAIPQKDYLACYEVWTIRWYKCISWRGNYF